MKIQIAHEYWFCFISSPGTGISHDYGTKFLVSYIQNVSKYPLYKYFLNVSKTESEEKANDDQCKQPRFFFRLSSVKIFLHWKTITNFFVSLRHR